MCSDKIVMIQEMEKDREAWHAAVHGVAKSSVLHLPQPFQILPLPFSPCSVPGNLTIQAESLGSHAFYLFWTHETHFIEILSRFK